MLYFRGIDRLYTMSYIWYSSLGVLTCVVVGLIVSFITGKYISRPPDKSVHWKIIFFISHPKHILWVLKRTISMI